MTSASDPSEPQAGAEGEIDATPAAKPARRRRSPAKAGAVAATPDEGVAPSREDASAAPSLAKAGTAPPMADEGAAPPVAQAPVEPAARPRVEAAYSAEDSAQGAAQDALQDAAQGERQEPEAGDGAGGSRAERRRRRNRRDRGRSERAPEEGAAAEQRQPEQLAEVFAEVLSGGFDAEDAPAPEAAAEQPAAYKRILEPDPNSPKLQKVLGQAGVGSRRDMEEAIQDGRITVNGEPAHVGQRISFGDRIEFNGRPVKYRIAPPRVRVLAYHKPVGEVVTRDDPQSRPTVFRNLPPLQQGKWQSVGRLDINTEGLLLFTNSGELANQLMHPRFGVEREYAVRLLGQLGDEQREALLAGVQIDGQSAGFKAIADGGGEGANHWYRVVITEGRNREVRKLFDAVGLLVSRLIRIRYGTVVLPRGLKRGVWVDLDDADVRLLRQLAGAAARSQPAAPPQRERRAQPEPRRARDEDDEGLDFDPSRIPNPLEQTFDRRFASNSRSPFGRGGSGGFGSGGSAPEPAPKRGSGPREPDPLQTSMGYIGADAFHRSGARGRSRGGPRGGGNRGGSYGR